MFLTKKEKKISQEYLDKGFVIQDINIVIYIVIIIVIFFPLNVIICNI